MEGFLLSYLFKRTISLLNYTRFQSVNHLALIQGTFLCVHNSLSCFFHKSFINMMNRSEYGLEFSET